jgi:hypothetical protein
MVKKNSIIIVLLIIITGTFSYFGYTGWKIQAEQKLKKDKQVIQNRTEDRKKRFPGGVTLPGDESYIAPIDTSKIVTDSDGKDIVLNQILVTLIEGEDSNTAKDIASSVDGKIVGFISPDTYQIELLSVSTIEELEAKMQTIEADSRVEIAIKNILYEPSSGGYEPD